MSDVNNKLAPEVTSEIPDAPHKAGEWRGRCEICGWPYAETEAEGCVPGNCSYRPQHGSDEWHRIQAIRASLEERVKP